MWNIAIPVLCVLAHLYLVILFLPGFWREIDERGFRWHNTFSLFVVPPLAIVLIASHVLRDFDSLSTWLLVVAFMTVDALVLVMVLAAVGLRPRRRRLA